MRKLCFALRDSKAECFPESPIFARTRAEAIRSLSMAVQDPNHPIAKNAKDFDMYELGSMDMVTGKLEGHSAPVHVISAWELASHE